MLCFFLFVILIFGCSVIRCHHSRSSAPKSKSHQHPTGACQPTHWLIQWGMIQWSKCRSTCLFWHESLMPDTFTTPSWIFVKSSKVLKLNCSCVRTFKGIKECFFFFSCWEGMGEAWEFTQFPMETTRMLFSQWNSYLRVIWPITIKSNNSNIFPLDEWKCLWCCGHRQLRQVLFFANDILYCIS